MNRMTLTRLAMAGAAFMLLAATDTPSQAASVSPAATQSTDARAQSSLIEAGYYGHGRHYRGRHHGGFRFFFAPVIVHDGYYGYDRYRGGGGPSCYSICREYRGPEYCRYNWRRYC